MNQEKNSQAKPKPLMKRLLAFLSAHHLWLVITVLTSLAAALLSLFENKAMQQSLDAGIAGNMDQMIKGILFISLIVILGVPISFLRSYGAGRFSEYSLFDIRQKTSGHIAALPIPYLDNHPSGDFISRLNSDTNLVQQFLQNHLTELIAQPLFFTGAVIYSFVISWKLTLFSFILMPIMMVIAVKLSKPVEKHSIAQQEALAEVNSIAQDSISGLTVSKAFTLEKTLDGKYDGSVIKAVSKALKVARVQALLSPVNTFMQILPIVLIFAYGGYLVIYGDMTFGGLLAFINLSNHVVNPLYNMPQILTSLRSATAALQRIFEVWDVPSERQDGKAELKAADEKMSAISFQQVRFSYKEEDAIFDELSFDIQPGENVALVGPSGCGKSTALRLITGFYQPREGSISIYGWNIESWRLDAMRNLMSLVSQDTYLFPESIYANIAYGKAGAAREQVEAAAKAAGIYDFIQGLPEKFDTQVGERGAKLSGGQRQRIAIARALLKDAPILLLDEATSALDVESEHEVQEALEQLMRNRTTLVIAHRLSTIKNAHRILVMNEGRIAEQGSHEELLKKGSLYSQLYYKQFALQDDASTKALEA